jgi:ABC-2 type transport system permease protein
MVVHADKLRQLFALRWKLFIRGFTRDTGRIVGTIFLVLFGFPFVASIAVGTFFAYRFLPSPANEEILFLVLAGVFLAWIVLPLFEFSVNEGLDISKLVLFPLTRAELMLSLIFSTLLDIPIVALLLIFAAVVAGWALSLPMGLFALLAMLVFYMQIIGTSQLVLALLMRTLQSRRFRDLSIIIFVLFSSFCSLLSQLISRISVGRSGSFNIEALKHLGFSSYLQWFPPGMVARSIEQAAHDNWGAGFAWLTVSLGVSVLVLYLWQVVVERSLSSPEGSSGARVQYRRAERREVAVAAQTVRTRSWERILSPQIFAITSKEFKYYWRDPQLKALLFQSLISSFILIAVLLFQTGRSSYMFGSGWLVVLAPLSVLLAMLSFSLNSLGMERQSLTILFLFPIEPQRILWGKNLAVFVIGFAEMVIAVSITAFVSQGWNLALPAFIAGLAGLGVVLGCGNFTSVFLPQRMREMQRGFRATGASSQGGCLRGFLSVVMLFVTVVLLGPVIVALGLPLFLHQQWIWIFAIPLALLYGIAFHQVVTRLVAPRMVDRTPEILAATTRE